MNAQETSAKIIKGTGIGSCIEPLLKALKWRGSRRNLQEAMPHFADIYTVPMFCDVMRHLNYRSDTLKLSLQEVDERLLPCFFVVDKGPPLVLLEKRGNQLVAFHGEMRKRITINLGNPEDQYSGIVYVFTPAEEDAALASLKISWVRRTFQANSGLFWGALFLSLIVNILMLATPLYVMNVYDRVVSTGSFQMLKEFVIGISIAFVGIIVIHQFRAKLIALLGARLDRAIGVHIFERLLYLTPAYTESATVGSQVARIRDFDRLRQFLAGPLLTTAFDVPFIFVAMIIIGLVAGALVVVPILMILIFTILGSTLYLKVQRAIKLSSFNGARQQEFILESIGNIRAIKYLGVEDRFEQRYRDFSANTNMGSLRVTVLSAINSALSDAIMVGSGMAILGFGALKIIEGTLSIGGMIATMILIWRVLAPIKTIFNTLPRIQQMGSSLQQINRLMQIKPETEAVDLLKRAQKALKGDIEFNRVSLRYQAAMDPALMGVSFKVKRGESVGIVGRNGSGKSTLLKVILGLYHPQAGGILIDGQDIRQMNPIELRHAIAYVPQKPELFYGTIAGNLLLGKPDATEEEMVEATKKAGIYEEIIQLPEGFDTTFRDFSASKLSASFQQGLCLARAYLKHSAILLLDEPGGVLDEGLDNMLLKAIETARGKTTVMMVTHRPSHLKKLDKILLIDQGQLLLYGSPEEVLPKIPKDLL